MEASFDQAFHDVRGEVLRAVGRDRLRDLHRASGLRHAALALRQILLLAACVAVILGFPDTAWAWVPATVLLGFVVFSCTVLLHEVVHGTVFARPRPAASRWLAFAYALPAGLSPSQFRRWHLDHHRWLGTRDEDPKRGHLTPKRVRRWVKALYLTPALFPIYLRAAREAASSYPAGLVARIRRERWAATLVHVALLGALLATLGAGAALRLYLLPVFVVFPVAFTLNRLGQHYDVVPGDPARWGTLLVPSPFLWDVLFLWSNHHLEHHYFPRVPCYRLPALRRALDPFFVARGARRRTYAGLARDWFLANRAPHTDWSRVDSGPEVATR